LKVKNFILFTITCFLSCQLFSQSFKVGTGISMNMQPLPGYRVIGSFGLVFSPRYVFDMKNNSYFSIGVPLTTGFSRLDDSKSVDLKLGMMADIPVIFNYNFNVRSAENDQGRFSFFAGGGFGYHYDHYTAANENGTITQAINGVGPVINAGSRFSLGKEKIHNFEIRLSYMKLLASSKSDLFGIGCIFNF
jgi:hypothetical protein